jgi:hypothetical protein
MRIEWDLAKHKINRSKHGIGFEVAQLVFDDPHCVTFVERTTLGEQRWHAIGSIETLIVIVVVHTYREEGSEAIIRIVSARRATRRERRLYVEAVG